MEILKPYMDADMDVVFLGISEDMSTTCNVLRLVANEFERGRCSGDTALLANTLKLHPRIEVKDGKMIVGTKYRGKINKVLLKYTKDMEESLKKADPARVFITHSGVDPEVVEEIREYLRGLDHFEEIIETRAGGVIYSHCGPGTLGVLFYQK